MVDMSKVLKEHGRSLAVVSSKFLEANNKVVKAIMRRLPGRGRRTSSFAHLPLVQGLKRCITASCVRRVELYKSIQNKEVDESVLD
jgi:NADH:ubiquinone oxidoreductase subunit E